MGLVSRTGCGCAEAAEIAGADIAEVGVARGENTENCIQYVSYIPMHDMYVSIQLYIGQVARSMSQGKLASHSGGHIPNTELSCSGKRTRPPCVLHLKVVGLELTYEM